VVARWKLRGRIRRVREMKRGQKGWWGGEGREGEKRKRTVEGRGWSG